MANKPELELIPEGELQICQFSGKEIRKVCHNDEWFFSVVDVIQALADTNRPAAYWGDLKSKMVQNEGVSELFDKIEKLPLAGKDGVKRPSEVANTETVFRIIQSIPSQKAEPFKQWLDREYTRLCDNKAHWDKIAQESPLHRTRQYAKAVSKSTSKMIEQMKWMRARNNDMIAALDKSNPAEK